MEIPRGEGGRKAKIFKGKYETKLEMGGSRKYPYLPHGRFFHLNSLPPGIHTFPYKFWLLRAPLPLRISNDLSCGGYDISWNHTILGGGRV